jgi:uncharacterized 2Fe-2S/4Fe-4S cluster protein (DUF4445 family)
VHPPTATPVGVVGVVPAPATEDAVTPPNEHRIVFAPSGRSGHVPHGGTVLDAARAIGEDLDTVCGGKGICGRCQVVPLAGSFATWAIEARENHVSAPGPLETDYRGRRPLDASHRLGCAMRVLGDLVVDVPAASRIHRQVVRKDLALEGLVLDPVVRPYYLEVPPAPEGSASALDRIRDVLAEVWGLEGVRADAGVLDRLQPALAEADGALTVAIRDAAIVAVWPGFVDRVVGVAVDVGSTTIAAHLVDLTTGQPLGTAGRMNPQIRYGEDLMSRVSYAMMNPGGAKVMTDAVRGALDELVGELLEAAELERSHVLELVVVGNPIMHHLVLGLDPTPLGQAPFELATRDAVQVPAPALSIACPYARVHVGPCIAGHVGADTAAAILAEGPHRSDAVQLLVDIGTNAEIVLGNRDGLFAASSPTGPAFEGAQLSSGQRATAGAIERVRIDRDTLEPRVRVIGVEPWSDEPGFEAATARTRVTGVCGSGIVEVVAELFLAGVIDEQGVVRGEAAVTSDRVVADGRTFSYVLHRGPPELRITQADVRAVQLAKAALRAGIDLLLERSPVARVDEVRLAGAFGAQIDPLHAMVLGLIPDGPLDAVRAVGNAAGAGAVRALVSGSQRTEMQDVAHAVTKIETAIEPRFQSLFVDALAIPHRSAPSAHLAEVVDLPVRRPPGPARRGPGAGRRRKEPA